MPKDDHHLFKGPFNFINPKGKDLAARCIPLRDWVEKSTRHGEFQYFRHHAEAPDTVSEVYGWGNQLYRGINLASQDYLGLAKDSSVITAAAEACQRLGTHSSGSEPMGGGFALAKEFSRELAAFIQHDNVVLFPTGWAAGSRGLFVPMIMS